MFEISSIWGFWVTDRDWFGLVWSMAFSVKRFLFHYRNTYYSIGYYDILIPLILLFPLYSILDASCMQMQLALSKAASPAAKPQR